MKKRVLITLYDMEIGGIERSLVNMLEHFDYDRYEVDLLVFRHTGELLPMLTDRVRLLPEERGLAAYRKSIVECVKDGQLLSAIVRMGCKYGSRLKALRHPVNRRDAGAGYIQMQLVSKYMARIQPRRRERYHAAISFSWPHDYTARNVRADVKIAWIHTDYSVLAVDRELDLNMWQSFDFLASVSPACTRSFLSRYPELEGRVVEIENIQSPSFVRAMADEGGVPPEMADDPEDGAGEKPFRIVSVGRLSYAKGFDLAARALRLLHDRGLAHIRWYIVGFGSMEAELKELAAELGLRDSFRLLGKKANPYPYMKAADLYVQPSRYEGKAVVVTEAQILGKPVLVADYPTAASQVTDGVDGYICPSGPEGLADAIERLVRDRGALDRVAEGARRRDYGNADELKKLYHMMA
ncbi:Capsular polysaccharide biosynthesis protein, Glycosyltransferase Family 4 [Thermobacillus xylanilyticus]|uniref:Glycosyltransferase n=2 Tax=Thermobacillus TaxID=76632 RepID=L0EHV9_THECK|nr:MULTISPECIES: glycosyltransferase [Thermobacillus]AGA59229.1 glycosyltransferase [Thermobacillus composti KWC4]CAG5086023.1 Capsular polysaccharide biosynthesis protein, Glycosyltransferase Family 4 [Thermobacillus xylanilyticus]